MAKTLSNGSSNIRRKPNTMATLVGKFEFEKFIGANYKTSNKQPL